MISHVLPSFKKTFKDIQEKARESYRRWKQNPYDKSLRFKRVHSSKPVYSVRVTLNWRALGILGDKNTITWFWIGSHEKYNKLLNQFKK